MCLLRCGCWFATGIFVTVKLKPKHTQRWFGPLLIIKKRLFSRTSKTGPKYHERMIYFPLVSPWKSYQNITVLWGECVLIVYIWQKLQTAIELVFWRSVLPTSAAVSTEGTVRKPYLVFPGKKKNLLVEECKHQSTWFLLLHFPKQIRFANRRSSSEPCLN